MAEKGDNTYFLDGDHGLAVLGQLTACSKCGRKILVEMGLIGVPHHTSISVTCGECLVLSKKFRKQQPEIVSKIERWLL